MMLLLPFLLWIAGMPVTPPAVVSEVASELSAGAARQLTINLFEASYTVDRDGVIHVEERITFRFDGSWNGVYRWIPFKYRLDDGRSHRIYLDVESVTDDDGNSLRHEVKREGALALIKTWVPNARNATRTVVYRYNVENGLRFFHDKDGMEWAHDELYWNVTGDEWKLDILSAKATVVLTPEVTGVRAMAYTGPHGAKGQDYEQHISGSTVSFATTRGLGYREGFTIVVGWDPGAVARPGPLTRTRWFLLAQPFLVLPLISFFMMFALWHKRGRDPDLKRSVVPEYTPPKGIRPAEVGVLMDFTVDPRDLTATIIDLAVRGYISIREGHLKDHSIHILKDPEEVTDLKDFESMTLRALWQLAVPADEDRQLSVWQLRHRFYDYVSLIRRRIYDALTAPPKSFTARPEEVWRQWLITGIIVAVVAMLLATLALKFEIGSLAGNYLSSAAVALPVLLFGAAMPARTRKGATVLNHVLGLREYIVRVDRDRLKHVSVEHFETLLPFAVAMGLEEKWTAAFESVLTKAPDWYVADQPGDFDIAGIRARDFSIALCRLASSTGQALMTAPRRASSRSGFGSRSSDDWFSAGDFGGFGGGDFGGGGSSGGGFSGGGFGGGGGGGF